MRLYLVGSSRSLVAISTDVYQPAKGAAGNWSPPTSNIIPATMGRAYHSKFKSSIALSLKRKHVAFLAEDSGLKPGWGKKK